MKNFKNLILLFVFDFIKYFLPLILIIYLLILFSSHFLYSSKLFLNISKSQYRVGALKHPSYTLTKDIKNINDLEIDNSKNSNVETDVDFLNLSVWNVEYGDTLSDISRKTNISVDTLAKLNDIKNVHLIYAGSSLKLK